MFLYFTCNIFTWAKRKKKNFTLYHYGEETEEFFQFIIFVLTFKNPMEKKIHLQYILKVSTIWLGNFLPLAIASEYMENLIKFTFNTLILLTYNPLATVSTKGLSIRRFLRTYSFGMWSFIFGSLCGKHFKKRKKFYKYFQVFILFSINFAVFLWQFLHLPKSSIDIPWSLKFSNFPRILQYLKKEKECSGRELKKRRA